MITRHFCLAGLGVVAVSTCVVERASAQIRSSERGTISQEIDGTRITVDFGRPQLRGRVAFPGIVHWGEVWTPGANWATTLEVNHPVKIEGQAIPAGKYSVWVTPLEHEWKVYLHTDWHRFHESRPKVETMAFTLPRTPLTGPSTEALTFEFPRVDRTGAVLEFRWGTVVLPLRIDVPPTMAPGVMTAAQAAPYVGNYTRIEYGPKKGDSTLEKMSVVLKSGRLHGITPDPAFEFAFIEPQKRGDNLLIAFLDKGEIADIEVAAPTNWVEKDGKVTGFIVRAFKDVWFKGVRTP